MRLLACLGLLLIAAIPARAEGLPEAPVWKIDPATRLPAQPELPAQGDNAVTTSTDEVTSSAPGEPGEAGPRMPGDAQRVLRVARGNLPSRTIASAPDGAVVLVPPGSYRDCVTIRANGLVVRPSTPGAILIEGTNCPGGVTILVDGDHVVLEHLVVRGARTARHSGTAIRIDGRDATLRHLTIRSSDQAIATGTAAAGTLGIENSLVEQAGVCASTCRPALATGPIARLVLRGSIVRQSAGGRHIDTAAHETYLIQNSLDVASPAPVLRLRGQGVAIVLGNRFAARAGAAGPQLCLVQTGPSVAQPALLRLDNNVVENENQRPLALLCAAPGSRAILAGNRFNGPVSPRAALPTPAPSAR